MLRRAMSTVMRPIYARIEAKVTSGLAPTSLIIKDESFKHAGHSGNPSGDPDAETHFKVEIVSAAFEEDAGGQAPHGVRDFRSGD